MAQSLPQRQDVPADRLTRTASPALRTRRSWGRVWLFFVILLALGSLAAAGVLAAYEFRYAERVFPGVKVAGLPLKGMTLDEAAGAIEADLTPYPGSSVVVRYGSTTWTLSSQELGVSVDGQATAQDALAVGRAGAGATLTDALLSQWQALQSGVVVPPRLRFDEGRVSYALMRIAREVDRAPQEGSLNLSGLDVVGTPGRAGRQVEIEATRAALLKVAQSGKGGTVSLVVSERQPTITSVDEAVAKANALLGQPLTLVARGGEATSRFAADRATLRQWLKITPQAGPGGVVNLGIQLNQELVANYLKPIAGQINRPVRDATLDWDTATKQVKVIAPSQVGQELDIAAGVAAIQEALNGSQREVQLPVRLVQPRVDMQKIPEMGIVEVVSQGSSTFAGSSNERMHNIANAAAKFRSVVLAPDEEFSFNKNVGEITVANGFVDALIITGDRTELGVGGGVCQVSTTMFRAAYLAGLPITERWAHSYVVGWYGRPGLDATIYTPSVDLKFKNDTGHFLLVRPEVDLKKGTLDFYLYGTRPNRVVESEGPFISNVREPGKPVYIEDKKLAAGTIKQVDWAVTGEDVVMVRRVRTPDGNVKEDKFVSKYQPWTAKYTYGPGTDLAAAQAGATATPAPAATPGPAAPAPGAPPPPAPTP